MNKKRTFAYILLSIAASMMVFTGISFAWFFNTTADIVPNPTGEVITSYFHCGSGTEEDPYVITRPVHLYNLTRLYEDLDGFAEANNHFQLGYDLDNDGDLECYAYNDHGVYQESYSDKLNMNYYENFVPIGSEEKPFGGVFDGSDLTIDNLNISGEGLSDIGVFGYVTEDATIQDLYIDNLDIDVTGAVADAHDAHDTNAYVGYIVGHLENANCVTNTYVNNCEITGSSCLVKNDWGYYGKCDNAGSLDDFLAHAGTEDPSWGGSVNMKNMYNRLYSIAGSATTNSSYAFEKDIVTRPNNETFERDALTGYAYTYRSQKEGSFVFSRYSSQNGPRSNFMYLNGGTRYHQYSQTETQVSGGQAISYNGHYLGVSGTSIADHQDGWQYSNNILSIVIDGVTYYLTHNLTLSTTTQEEWTKNGNRLYYTTGGFIGIGSTYHYITYDNGWVVKETTRRNNATQLTWTNTTYTKVTESSSGPDYMDYSGTNVTYFPLITEEDSYNVGGKNTGYVMGGSEDNTTNAYPDKTGDIRVSKYSTSDISNSYSNRTLTNVYTVSASNQTVAINTSDYTKYLESKAEFLDMISDGNIYGLHFMPANISINHLVSADYALINGVEKTNYQMPASSIDFNLLEKGYINFFAGTYFSGNNSFFSLHHIERDENDEITSIKEIAEIYKSSSDRDPYIYKYTDNTYSDTLTSSYSLAFSTNRIKRQSSITTNAVYYFEIPVNAGEFALGSVDGGTGAYLMYLDIGSNGGVDFNAQVDTFGSVEYRSSPDIAETSLLLITYEQQSNQTVSLVVVYIESEKRYNITYSGTLEQIIITVLSEDYEVYFNGTLLPQRIQKNYLS